MQSGTRRVHNIVAMHLAPGKCDTQPSSGRCFAQTQFTRHRGRCEKIGFAVSRAVCRGSRTCLQLPTTFIPGVRISGVAGQSERLPCFVLGYSRAILPAFGRFTGLAIHSRKASARWSPPLTAVAFTVPGPAQAMTLAST
jgi:hypothetical protein